MTVARDLITSAAREAGLAASDVPLEAEHFDDCLGVLNRMLPALPNDAITVWKQSSGSITLTNATASYTIPERPFTLETVNYKVNGVETWLYAMSRSEYHELSNKTSNGRPSQVYYQRRRDDGVLFVWPVLATATGTVEWSGVTQIATVADGNTVLDIPREWEEAVQLGLARRIASYYSITSRISDLIAQEKMAMDSAKGADVECSVTFQYADS